MRYNVSLYDIDRNLYTEYILDIEAHEDSTKETYRERLESMNNDQFSEEKIDNVDDLSNSIDMDDEKKKNSKKSESSNNKFNNVISIIGIIVGIFGAVVGWIGARAGLKSLHYIEFFYENGIETYSEYRDVLKYKKDSDEALGFWLEDVSKVRVGCSDQYIKGILGEPINTDEIVFYEEKYRKDLYISPYCTIMCLYNQDSSLIGYLVIGNDSSFKAQNYRCGFELFSYTMNEADQYCKDNHIGAAVYFSNNINGRTDCNNYFFQCNFEHSYGAKPPYYIGFGVCDIGAIDSYDSFSKAIHNMSKYDVILDFESNHAYQDYYEATKNDLFRNIPINSMFIMKEIPHMNEFIYSFVAGTKMCLSVDDFANYQDDYCDYINRYIERNREYGQKYMNQSTEDDE